MEACTTTIPTMLVPMRYVRRPPRRDGTCVIAAKCTESIQDDYVVPAANDKGKGKSTLSDARSLSIAALQETVAKDIRRVADLTGLQVSAARSPSGFAC